MANKFSSLPDLDNGSGNTRSLRSGWDEFGNPCTKLASAGGPGAGADGFLTTLASVFLPVEANACDVGGRPAKNVEDIINSSVLDKSGKTIRYTKKNSKGYVQALNDFDSLKPDNVKTIKTVYGDGKTGILADGTKITVRPGSTDGAPTLDIVRGKKHIKIRY